MSPIRFLMLGGFLGAGKTTTIARLARHYQSRGMKVGIVTNDQATDLVDTNSLRAQGFDVGEVPGACFCCNFNKLTETVGELEKSARPDIVLAEPVGSCTDLLSAQYPGTPVLRMSAKTGAGFDALVEFVDQRGRFGQRLMEVDYDTYAIGEAELGWLNSSLNISAAQPIDLDGLLLDIISRLQASLAQIEAETAHLKAIGMADGLYGVANLVSRFSPPELSLASRGNIREAELVINARVATAPETLTEHVEQAVSAACSARGATATFQQTQSFRPGRPQPTHRILE